MGKAIRVLAVLALGVPQLVSIPAPDPPRGRRTTEQARDLGAAFLGFVREAQARKGELVAQIPIGEAVHGVLAPHHGGEELSFGSGQGVEDLDGPRHGGWLAGRDLVQSLQGNRGVVDFGQGVQVPGVALE